MLTYLLAHFDEMATGVSYRVGQNYVIGKFEIHIVIRFEIQVKIKYPVPKFGYQIFEIRVLDIRTFYIDSDI